MTVPESPLSTPDGSQLQLEAATWFARMRGPNAKANQAEFDAWLASSAHHIGAYNRAAEIWSLGKFLAEPATGREPPAASELPTHRRRSTSIALSVCALLVVLLGGWLTLSKLVDVLYSARPEVADPRGSVTEPPIQLATAAGDTRSTRLSDGSVVTLNPNSKLMVAFNATGRQLRLEHGGARFEVAHEARPFVVSAANGTVTARGTIFDVGLSADHHVTVRLLRGSVDVALPAAPRPAASVATNIRRLAPGDQIDFADGQSLFRPASTRTTPGAAATVDLDHVRLEDLLAIANRQRAMQIALADPSLSDLRVSGSLRVDDTDQLAIQLAAVLDLNVDRQSRSRIVLRRR